MSTLRKSLLSGRGKNSRSGPADFTPIKWSKYFESHNQVSLDEGTFHYYKKGSAGPLLVALHGGGYSALTWSLFSQEVTTRIECQIMAIDLRGHGNTNTENDLKLSLEQLAMDIKNVIFEIYKDEDLPPIVLIGHSLGGAVAVEVAPMIPSLVGLCVIDVVEGTALDSLSTMQSILRGRPNGFKTISHAVQWGFRGGSTQNLEAAKVSMPGQIKNGKTNMLASEEVELNHPFASIPSEESGKFSPQLSDAIFEENEELQEGSVNPAAMKPPLPTQSTSSLPQSESHDYVWRIDLTKTEQYWPGWFKGLSQKFLNVNAPKILILANIYGLDTSLTVGQMQGKFQLQVLSRSGHAVHEDQPDQVADILATYLVRQKLAVALQGFVPMVPGC